MSVRLLTSMTVLLSAATLSAQTPATAAKPRPGSAAEFDALVAERIEFVRKTYQISNEQATRLQSELNALIPNHKSYMSRNENKLRLRTTTLSKVLPDQQMSDSIKARLTEKFQNEIFDVHTNAPLSLTNTVKKTEGMLSKAQIEKGRQVIAQRFAVKLKGATLNLNKLDHLILEPIRPSPSSEATPEPGENPKPTPVAQNPAPSEAAKKPNAKPQAETKTRPPRPKPRKSKKPLEPAPPIETWSTVVETKISKYVFSDLQKNVAQRVLLNCRQRAQSHLAHSKADYDQANQLAGPEKAKKLKELNRPLDGLFDELNQRIDSIASEEQKRKSATEEKRQTARAEKK